MNNGEIAQWVEQRKLSLDTGSNSKISPSKPWVTGSNPVLSIPFGYILIEEVDNMGFMKNLGNQLKKEKCYTENGAVGYKTSGKELLDLNFKVSSMRNWDETEIEYNFIRAFYENPLLAVKWLFYLRDIRGCGMGERRTFRICMKWLVKSQFDMTANLIGLIPEYGRFDDWFCLLDTEAAGIVLSQIKNQLEKDICNMKTKKEVSLLAKWLPSCNTSSAKSRENAGIICRALGMTRREYRRMLVELRAYLKVVEVDMAAGNWENIDYSKVPSRANLVYGRAFLRNDEERRRDFLSKLTRGEVKINADTLFPSDIVAKYQREHGTVNGRRLAETDETLEGLWHALPDYVNEDGSTLVVRDGSGSMRVGIDGTGTRALDVSTALAIYFSEHSRGEFHDKFISFSSEPKMIDLSNASSLREKLEICAAYDDCTNTDIWSVFSMILETAVENHMRQEDLPKNVLIVSDMEFDHAFYNFGGRDSNSVCRTLFEEIGEEFRKKGYKLPRLIFWNVCTRTEAIPLRENDGGVALVSGFSPAVYNMVLSDKLDPYECLLAQINSKRYEPVEKALA